MAATERREIWLRGNVRPVVVAAAVAALAGAAGLAGLVAAGSPAWLRWLVCGAVATTLAAVAAVGLAAGRPRLARCGNHLEIRLSPTGVERVPLDVVECVFRGTEPVTTRAAGFRVGTLVVRFAERAAGWRARDTFRPWGTWDEGHAVIDGRWCEPLSRQTVERLAGRLLEAKRETGT